MSDKILNSFDTWINAQGLKLKGRVKSVDNISLEGIGQLRKAILILALKGKLSFQNSSETVSGFENIESLPNNSTLANWKTLKVGSCFDIKSGASFHKSKELDKGDYLYLKVADLGLLENEKEIKTSSRYISPDEKELRALIPAGSIIFPKRGGAIATNKKRITNKDLFVDLNIMTISPQQGILLDYAYIWINSFDLSELNTGTSVPQINHKDIDPLIFPIPPLAEQLRIITKVDELMALCDDLEQQTANHLKSHQLLVETLLATLTDATNFEGLTRAWSRLETHFDDLFTTEDSIDQLKQTILQLAIRGKLVPQDPEEEVTEFENDTDFSNDHIPGNWKMVKILDCFDIKSGSSFDKSKELEAGAYLYLKVADLNLPGNEKVIQVSSRYLNPNEKELKALIPSGSIIFPKRGGAIATNKKRLVKQDIFVDLNTMSISPKSGIMLDYAFTWILGIDLAELNTGTSVPQINHKDIGPLGFPVPPIEEQKRIITKVDELFKVCDLLNLSIIKSADIESSMASSILDFID